jgi:heme-degrading monooxygenase HmoA
MATKIDSDRQVATLINTFTVDPERQEELVRMLADATRDVIRHMPGFVSANIHRGLDGTHVANYAQWRTREDLEAMLGDPRAQAHLRAIAGFTQFEPLLYSVEEVIGADAD